MVDSAQNARSDNYCVDFALSYLVCKGVVVTERKHTAEKCPIGGPKRQSERNVELIS